MSKHTPTPWEVGTHRPYIVARTNPETDTSRDQFYVSSGTPTGGSGWPVISYDEREANAARIVACVNALADRDPAKLGELEEAIGAVVNDGPLLRGQVSFSSASAISNLRGALAAFRKAQQPTKETR